MPFENLAYRYHFNINDIPHAWIPLISLYDPDLPLFPIYYFHALKEDLQHGHYAEYNDRIYGYVEKISFNDIAGVDITIITNKDLEDDGNSNYKNLAISEVKERLGILNPVTRNDVSTAFQAPHTNANNLLNELWTRVVSYAYGDKLPFGRLWDEILGLTRFVASWYSPGGRKSELIMTHYFCSKFGEKINISNNITKVDFYLLPTLKEVIDITNNLVCFPNYKGLIDVSNSFHNHYCSTTTFSGLTLSKFVNPETGSLNTEKILNILNGARIPTNLRSYGVECFNAFDKGPPRTIIFLLMINDLRNGRLKPSILNQEQLGSIYDKLSATYQSPKVIHIYSQQSFGNERAAPIDVWVETFFHWPLVIFPTNGTGKKSYIIKISDKIGKIERLIWVTAQARKVHSSACNDAVWCIKKASIGTRGANPLACKICLPNIRNVCPAYEKIKSASVSFNSSEVSTTFKIITNSGNNTILNQNIVSCSGKSIYNDILDDFSPSDSPNGITSFPQEVHDGSVLTVEEFIRIY